MKDEALNWDPPKELRRYFRHAQTGDLGFLVRREGKDHVRLDRPNSDEVIVYREGDWKEEKHAEPLAAAHAVQVSFAAHKALCLALGFHVPARKEWASLPVQERVNWLKNGPKGPPPIPELHRAIMEVLGPYTRPE